MVRYGIRTLLALIALTAVACAVIGLRPIYRAPVLFGLIVIAPAPLIVTFRRGSPAARSFAAGCLATYLAWLLVGGIPSASIIVYRFLEWDVTSANFYARVMDNTVCNGMTGWVGLYMPWIVVPLGGLAGLLTHCMLNLGRQN